MPNQSQVKKCFILKELLLTEGPGMIPINKNVFSFVNSYSNDKSRYSAFTSFPMFIIWSKSGRSSLVKTTCNLQYFTLIYHSSNVYCQLKLLTFVSCQSRMFVTYELLCVIQNTHEQDAWQPHLRPRTLPTIPASSTSNKNKRMNREACRGIF